MKELRRRCFDIIKQEGHSLNHDLLYPQSAQRKRTYHNSTGKEHCRAEDLEECTERLLAKLMNGADASNLVPFFVGEGPLSPGEKSVSMILSRFHWISHRMIVPYECDPMQPTLAVIRRRLATMTVVLPDELQKYMER